MQLCTVRGSASSAKVGRWVGRTYPLFPEASSAKHPQHTAVLQSPLIHMDSLVYLPEKMLMMGRWRLNLSHVIKFRSNLGHITV